jgi:ribonuclease HII
MQSSLFDRHETIGDIERELRGSGYRFVVGLDEAGRGPLAGPVYAAAVLIDLERLDDDWLKLLNDSKQLSESKRELAEQAMERAAVIRCVTKRTAAQIDEINILQASLRAMEEALSVVSSDLDQVMVLVDGKQRVLTELPQTPLIKGDARSLAIAAASILAKVGRDREMLEHHKTWPEYGFDGHKGYPSKRHREAVAEHGPCAIHRLSFAGVREHAHRLRT